MQIDKSIARLRSLTQRLDTLLSVGLSKQEAFVIFATFVNGGVTYAQRAQTADPRRWRLFDDEVVATLGRWLGSPLTPISRKALFQPAKLGGGGLASAELRTDAAYLASWAKVETAVFRAQGVATAEASGLRAPSFHTALSRARERVLEMEAV